MSTFIHGGSALQLDIAGRAHAALTRGDVVQIDPAVGATDDGLSTRDVGNLNNCLVRLPLMGLSLAATERAPSPLARMSLFGLWGCVRLMFRARPLALARAFSCA